MWLNGRAVIRRFVDKISMDKASVFGGGVQAKSPRSSNTIKATFYHAITVT